MKFPAYWARATAEETVDGESATFSCWRWSDTSREDARNSALGAAKRIVSRLVRGEELSRYPYGQQPLREEVLQRITNERGELTVAVTQNAYGSLVMNTARAMFLDIDFPAPGLGSGIRNFFGGLMGKKALSPEDEARAKVEQFQAANRQLGLRLYRTSAGLRLLVVNDLFDPTADTTRRLMESVGTDPLYVKLCRAQECFRARLTPKPWRCGHFQNRVTWPRETEEEQRLFDEWQSAYLQCQSTFATCRFVEEIGPTGVHPEIEPVIELHDRLTRCQEPLELA
jgi:hypothetical protein